MKDIHRCPSLMSWVVLFILGSTGVVSCSAAPNRSLTESTTAGQAAPESSTSPESAPSAPQDLASSTPVAANTTPRQAPQLIKTASLTLRVDNVEAALDAVNALLETQQGDLLKLENQQSKGTGDRDIYSLQLRIPQNNLNAALNALEDLGSVTRRSIQAQDVSDQLVDAQARLKNLRKSEEMVLTIMERSGSIPDVLNASKELSNIRENIERIDAQLQSLKARVAFSTINLRLESATVSVERETKVGTQLQDAWKRSTNAMGGLTMAFLKLGIWGIAFSPYIVALGLLIWLAQIYRRKTRTNAVPAKPES